MNPQKQVKKSQVNHQKVICKNGVGIQNNQQIQKYILEYKRSKQVKALKVPTPQTNHYHKQVRKTKTLFQLPNFDKIIDCPPNYKLILVEKDFKIEDVELFKNKEGESINNCEIVDHQITINYKNLSTQQLFDLFSGGKIPYPNSFQTVGHLAHFNLTTQQIPYHKVIGEITLLKALNITCVVNKTQKLHNIYRTPTLQMMAGTKQYNVKLRQVGTAFEFDFQKVYWCSRLQQERDRVLSKMNKNECLADIFCGCGPLAVRAAKKGLYVIANDLNPYGYEYLMHNCNINKVQDHMICYNMCARQVMRKMYKDKQMFPIKFQNPDHIYMNLPVDAIQFLDVFTNYGQDMKTEKMPLVLVNCFVVADSDQKSKQLLSIRIGKALPGFAPQDIEQMHLIKNVTIIMRMYCVAFRLRSRYAADGNINRLQQLQNKQQGNKHVQDNEQQKQEKSQQFEQINGRKRVKEN